MTESYSESEAYVAGLTLPVDTELATMTTLSPAIKRIADRTKYLLERIAAAASAYVHVVPLTDGTPVQDSTEWSMSAGNTTEVSWIQLVASGEWMRFGLRLPRGNAALKITEVKCYLEPETGHGAVPSIQPSIRLVRQPLVGGALTSIGSATMAAGSVGAYEVSQTLTITPGGGHVVLATDTYYLEARGEGGTNTVVGLKIWGLTVTTEPA